MAGTLTTCIAIRGWVYFRLDVYLGSSI